MRGVKKKLSLSMALKKSSHFQISIVFFSLKVSSVSSYKGLERAHSPRSFIIFPLTDAYMKF